MTKDFLSFFTSKKKATEYTLWLVFIKQKTINQKKPITISNKTFYFSSTMEESEFLRILGRAMAHSPAQMNAMPLAR